MGHTLPPDLVPGFQSAAHDLCSLQSDLACLLPFLLGLCSSLPGALEQLLSPTPVPSWFSLGYHLFASSSQILITGSRCKLLSKCWLVAPRSRHPPSHLRICVSDYLSPDAVATFFQVESAQCYFLPGLADISRSLLQPQMQSWKCGFPGHHMGPGWGQPVTLLRGPTPP